MRCCAVWGPVGKCFVQCSFGCIDFHGLSHIIASLTRERLAERGAAVHNTYLGLGRKKDNDCRLSLRAWGSKKPVLCLRAVTYEDGHPLEDVDESGMRLCTYWVKIFEPRTKDERHLAHETILEHVQTAPDHMQWNIDNREFDEMIAYKKRIRTWTRWYSI